jgi:iron complex transport system permease protein
MLVNSKYKIGVLMIGVMVILLSGIHLFFGTIDISISDFVDSFVKYDENNLSHLVLWELRIPRTITAIIAGASLSLAGMIMQTLFQNPLAGPYILGVNSGASLTVALGTLTGISFFQTNLGILGSALIGAFLFGIIILFFSYFFKSLLSLLLIGIMLGSFTSAITSILLAIGSPENIKVFTLWGMGSLQKVEYGQTLYLITCFLIALLALAKQFKAINAMLLGENGARNLGINIRLARISLISITALLSGVITAFCGPISFVGLAIPNLSRVLFKTTDHKTLSIFNILLGAFFLLFADLITILFESSLYIPINAITALIGAPFIMFIVIKKIK